MALLEYGEKDVSEVVGTPIQIVSETYGTDGLRRRLAFEVLESFDGQDLEFIDDAYSLATEVHCEDRRQREPVENHLLRVAIRGISGSHIDKKDAIMVAGNLLHDSVEDHSWSLAKQERSTPEDEARQMALETLTGRFGIEVSTMVGWMTNPLPREGQNKIEAYREQLDAIAKNGPWRSALGKFGEIADNCLDVYWLGGAYREGVLGLAYRYSAAPHIFAGILERSDIVLSRAARKYITDQLELIDRRLEVVLAGE